MADAEMVQCRTCDNRVLPPREYCMVCVQAEIDGYSDGDDSDGEDDDPFDECGLMRDGQCSMAGTEHCDFECPNRESELFCGSAAWQRKHAKK